MSEPVCAGGNNDDEEDDGDDEEDDDEDDDDEDDDDPCHPSAASADARIPLLVTISCDSRRHACSRAAVETSPTGRHVTLRTSASLAG